MLHTILANHGRDACDDARICKGLLLDYCGKYRLETSALVHAVEERCVIDLIAAQGPLGIRLTQLTKRLEDNLGLRQDVARWAIESWALALGMALPAQPAPRSSQASPVVNTAARPVRVRSVFPSRAMLAITIALGIGGGLALWRLPVLPSPPTVTANQGRTSIFHQVAAARRGVTLSSLRIALLDTHSQRPITAVIAGKEIRIRLAWHLHNVVGKPHETVTWRIMQHRQIFVQRSATDMARSGTSSWDYYLTVGKAWVTPAPYTAVGVVQAGGQMAEAQVLFRVANPVAHSKRSGTRLRQHHAAAHVNT